MHTPGPWHIDGDIKTMTHGCTSRPIACDDHQVAYVFVDSGKFEGDVGDANARLIAAAPDSHEANKSSLMVLCAIRGAHLWSRNMLADIDFAIEANRVALAKVKGAPLSSEDEGSPQADVER